jgi:hypothetical protein
VLQQQSVVRYQQSNNYLPPALQQLLSLSLTMLAVMQPAAFYSLKMPPWPVWQPIAFPQSELLLVQIPRQWPTPSHGALQT